MYKFSSLFAQRMEAFIAEKRALGYGYEYGVQRLGAFDRFCLANFSNEKNLTKELCLEWAKSKGEQNQTLMVKHSPIREFARYLISCGENAYILPPRLVRKGNKPIPYIFSEDEILSFWRELDAMKYLPENPYRHIVMPFIFRLFYCCGLRIYEAYRLRVEDVDVTTGQIYIRESKGHRDRIVVMSDDVNELCHEYIHKIEILIPGRKPFFPNHNGDFLDKKSIGYVMNTIWKKSNPESAKRVRPKVYDFRHSFATHRLYKWMKEGKDLLVMLPYLSAYMGHASLSSTHYYIHLVPGMYESMAGVDYSRFNDLLPEVANE